MNLGGGTRGTWAKIQARHGILSYFCMLEGWCFSGRLMRGKGPFPVPIKPGLWLLQKLAQAAHNCLLPKAKHRSENS